MTGVGRDGTDTMPSTGIPRSIRARRSASPAASGAEIVAGVRRAPQPGLLREVLEDEDGGFPGDALGLAEHVLVSHQVAHHQDTAILEPLNHPEEVGDLRATHGPIGGMSRRFGS